jgi:acyl dehydratase
MPTDLAATTTVAALQALVGQTVGHGSPVRVTQEMIDAFAAVTGDDQFIHVDVERARQTLFGGTIAHGMLTLSLLTGALSRDVRGAPTRLAGRMTVNMGLREVRFLSPVPAGSVVHTVVRLLEVAVPDRGQWTDVTKEHAVYVEGAETPALVAQVTTRTYR